MSFLPSSNWSNHIHGFIPLPKNGLGSFVLEIEGPVSEKIPKIIEDAVETIRKCHSWHDIDDANDELSENATYKLQIKPARENQETQWTAKRKFKNSAGAKFEIDLTVKSTHKDKKLSTDFSNFEVVVSETNNLIENHVYGQNLLKRVHKLAIDNHLAVDKRSERKESDRDIVFRSSLKPIGGKDGTSSSSRA